MKPSLIFPQIVVILLLWCGYIFPDAPELRIMVKKVDVTAYAPLVRLTDDTPFEMASLVVATPEDLERLRFVAVSRDLKRLGIEYGDMIFIGFEVQDLMGPKAKNSIDIFFETTLIDGKKTAVRAKLFGRQKRSVIFFLGRR